MWWWYSLIDLSEITDHGFTLKFQDSLFSVLIVQSNINQDAIIATRIRHTNFILIPNMLFLICCDFYEVTWIILRYIQCVSGVRTEYSDI